MDLQPIATAYLAHPLAAVQREIMGTGLALMPEPVHAFGPHCYIRGLPMPAGLLIIGRLHKSRHQFQLTRGTVLIDNGDGPVELTADLAPITLITEPGTKRAIVAITDAYVQTVHVTDETDLGVLESLLLEPEPDLPRLELPR
jgi:hypothetical protein